MRNSRIISPGRAWINGASGVAIACSLGFAGQAHAQDAEAPAAEAGILGPVEPEAAPAGPGAGSEEIVVTARKRSELARNVPVAVSAISGAALVEQNVSRLTDIVALVPNFSLSLAAAQPITFVRGFGTAGGASFEQAVGKFVDNVSYGRDYHARIPLFDIERFELLKGPQVLLYGNSATAGALNITTRKPGGSFAADASVAYEFVNNELVVQGGVTAPLADWASVRVAGFFQDLDKGWIYNEGIGEHQPTFHNYAVRPTLRLTPTPELDILLKVEVDRVRDRGNSGQSIRQASSPARTFPEVELDDRKNTNYGVAPFHPAAVVFPPALAVAQAIGASGRDLVAAVVAGYEVGIRVGEFLGRSHYRIFHTTGTAGALAATAAVGRLLRLSSEQMVHAFGSAGTQAAGLWQFLRDAADSKPLHTAHATGAGLTSAYLALDGFTGARDIFEGARGLAAGMSSDADPARLDDRLGTRWALAETSFKFHASCRHTHPAADALLQVLVTYGLSHSDIQSVVAHVHQGAIDVLGAVIVPRTVHQAKFSMGSVLGLCAVTGGADLETFERVLDMPEVAAFRGKVAMMRDPEVDAAYPNRWIGKVVVRTVDGRELAGRVDEPKGDPGNTLSREEIERKAINLARFGGAASEDEMRALFERLWRLPGAELVGRLLA